MPRLPQGIVRRKGRVGYYVRVQRGGQDRKLKAGDTVAEAAGNLSHARYCRAQKAYRLAKESGQTDRGAMQAAREAGDEPPTPELEPLWEDGEWPA